jgi:hypothetical protein
MDVMNKLWIAVGAAAILAASSVAGYADEASGAISAIDPVAGTVTLADGALYVLPSVEDAASLEVGQEVTIEFEETGDGQLMATSISPTAG